MLNDWTGDRSTEEEMELMRFSDASSDGYDGVIYSRREVGKGYSVRLIAARGRVNPLKAKANLGCRACMIPKLGEGGPVRFTA